MKTEINVIWYKNIINKTKLVFRKTKRGENCMNPIFEVRSNMF